MAAPIMPGWLRLSARATLLVACLFVLVRSVRIGWADALSHSGDTAKLSRAVELEPRNEIWPARLALMRLQKGEASPELRAELERCSLRRPGDSALLMGLGLLDEQMGSRRSAESYLLRAATVDKGFKPAWTLANYYFRTGAVPLMWPYLRRCLDLIEPRNLEAWSFDPTPIYNLAWEASDDPRAILGVIPPRRETLVPYLTFLATHPQKAAGPELVARNPLQLGAEAWPLVIRVAEPADREALLAFLDQLVADPSVPGAAGIWNDLIDKGFLPKFRNGGALRQDKALADPQLTTSTFDHGFGWRVPFEAGVNASLTPRALSLEFTGGEKEHGTLLQTYAAVEPGKTYLVRMEFDDLPPHGLRAEVTLDGSPHHTSCKLEGCFFTAPAGVYTVPVCLRYDRPPGEMRLRGSYTLRGLVMEAVR